MTKLALFDLDGTLSDDSHRRDLYIPGTYSEYWNPELMLQDQPFPGALDLISRLQADGWSIGVLSARLASYNAEVTEAWLAYNALNLYPVFLRTDENKDLTPPEYKSKIMSIYATPIGKAMFEEVVLYDNDPDVVDRIHADLGDEYATLVSWDVDEGSPA
jgi:hypothetical protein